VINLIPKSLLARIVLVILIALIASQIMSVTLFRYYTNAPRVQLLTIGFMTQLRTVRTALESIPPEQHLEFIKRLREDRGIRVIRPRTDEALELAPDLPVLRIIRQRLKNDFGDEADFFIRPRNKPDAPETFVAKITAGGSPFWVVFPRSHLVQQDFSWAWAGWGVFGGVLALVGAIFVLGRVNRPLRQLADAARAFGQGKNPPAVTEIGPAEVRAVSVAFNQMREDLATVERERATFLAGVSHDLRTPLSRLRLGIEMLPADKTTRDDLEKDIEDINDVIEQFMDFARDESRESLEPVDVNALVRDAASRAERSGAKISLELAQVPAVKLRTMAVRRVLGNLIDNAMKHAGPEITLRTLKTGNEISLSVLDRGTGIPPADIERLKQPFTRLDAARSGASGAGLGLAIVERIAKIHGGALQLLPRVGGGLEARVTLLAEPS
jgi:two-component system, OmpR family, osmolarity sensor histidine kinase EnvZ